MDMCVLCDICQKLYDINNNSEKKKFCRKCYYKQYYIDNRELIKEQNHEMIYDMIFNYTATELNILALLRKMDITGEEILKFITQDEDPFKWYNNIKNFI